MPVFRTDALTLASGARLAPLEVAYEIHGNLAPDRGNAILAFHGITSTHHGADPPTLDRRRGWWHEVIGPRNLLNTDRFAVITTNILGSCYGTTGPASTDPATGRPYGAGFPRIGYEDIVAAQKALTDHLGIERLLAVAGASIGGFQAFQWAVSYPDAVQAVLALDTGPWDTLGMEDYLPELRATFAADPNWNAGDFYSTDGVTDTLTRIRIATLESYGIREKLAVTHPPDAIDALILETARDWAEEFDPHALIRQTEAWAAFDLRSRLGRIRAKVFYSLCDTDEIFPAATGREVNAALRAAGVDLTYLEVKSPLGHYATTEQPEKWEPQARAFLASLDRNPG